ncbi:MAG: hypothetical protein P8130_04180 [Deltaproteobacteria bacterium]
MPDESASARLQAEQQARAFCESQSKQYIFTRFITWNTVRLGRNVPTYNLYFLCKEVDIAQPAEPEKVTPKKSEGPTLEETPSQEEAAVSAGKKDSEKTVMIITPEPPESPEPLGPPESEVSAPSADIRTIEARPSKIKVAELPRERGRRMRQTRTAKAALWFTTKDKDYIPGAPEPLAPPGEEEHPSILGGNVVEETLEN